MLISTTIATIVAAVTAVGKALAVAGLAVEGLKAVCGAIAALGKALGLVPQEQKIEDLGEKALQAEEAGIRPENPEFQGKYELYAKAISDFKIDPNNMHNEAKQLSKGAEVVSGVIQEKYPNASMPEMVAYMTKNPDGLFSEKNMGIISELVKAGKSFGDILKTPFDPKVY